ncbi:ABC transporter substrate-binding protein [Clostridium sp. CTA-7]
MKKRLISALLCGVLTFTGLVGCSSSNNGGKTGDTAKEDVTLSFMTNLVGVPSEELEKVCKDFTDETGIKIEYSAPGSNYEELMKTKMAANDLPDLWTTHGWSVARYSEYLKPLTDQSWVKDIKPAIKPMITNEKNDIFVLPINMDIAGIVYNVEVLEKSGVKVDDIKTWADFEVALGKIKAAGFTPIHMGGKDNWTIGQFFDWVAPSFYVTNDAKNYKKQLLDGTFDWNLWGDVAGLFDKWNKAGYFNLDSLTSDYLTDIKSFADGKVAFEFYGNYAITEALKVNPNAKLGMMPIPSNSKDDEPSLIAGERIAVGMNKNTKNEEAALKFINYLAKPEVAGKLASVDGMPSGLTNVTADTGAVQQYYDKYANVETFPYFDRVYLPSGMWDDMCITGADILAGKPTAVQDSIKHMEQSFKDKFSQKR